MSPRQPATETWLDRFHNSYFEQDGCWIWNRSFRADGYPRVAIKSKWKPAHRISYEIYKGEIPEGHMVCHTCDNPACVNPKHLYAGTARDNVHDKYKRKRNIDYRGENNPNYKHGKRVGKFQNRVF